MKKINNCSVCGWNLHPIGTIYYGDFEWHFIECGYCKARVHGVTRELAIESWNNQPLEKIKTRRRIYLKWFERLKIYFLEWIRKNDTPKDIQES